MLAFWLPRVAIREDFLDAIAQFPIVRSTEPQLLECSEGFGMFREGFESIDEEVVRKKLEATLRGDRWIEHANRTRCRIARIDENLGAHLLLMAVHRFKRLARHQNFAAYFEVRSQLGFFYECGVDAQRNGANGLHVRRDIFAGRAVTSSHAAHQDSVFVLQRNAQPIEFMLGNVFNFIAANSLPHAPIEITQRLIRKRVVEAQHLSSVANGLESGARSATDTSCR